MVRFIDVINQGGAEDEKEKKKVPDGPQFSGVFKKTADEEKKEEGPALKENGPEPQNGGVKKSGKKHDSGYIKDLYLRMVRASVLMLKSIENEEEIEKKRVEDVVSEAADVFIKEPYNDLLLYFYAFSRESYLVAHMANDAVLTLGFGASMGFSREELVELGGISFCHDIGMTYYRALFNKRRKLRKGEMKEIKGHSARSCETMRDILDEKACVIISDVHRIEDGKGYPSEEKDREISPWAEVIAICDTYEALTHERAYRHSLSPYEAVKAIIGMKKQWVRKKYVREFVDFISIYPVGSLVYLNTEEIAVVTESNKGIVTQPVVKVILIPQDQLRRKETMIDISKNGLLHINRPVEEKLAKKMMYFSKMKNGPEIVDIDGCSVVLPVYYNEIALR